MVECFLSATWWEYWRPSYWLKWHCREAGSMEIQGRLTFTGKKKHIAILKQLISQTIFVVWHIFGITCLSLEFNVPSPPHAIILPHCLSLFLLPCRSTLRNDLLWNKSWRRHFQTDLSNRTVANAYRGTLTHATTAYIHMHSKLLHHNSSFNLHTCSHLVNLTVAMLHAFRGIYCLLINACSAIL